MGRPRGFDEAKVVRSAAELFASRSYDGISIDELVTHLGVHRNSLYKTFGSKRGLYLAALRWSLEHDIAHVIDRVAGASDLAEALQQALAEPTAGAGLDLLLLTAVERAPVDTEVAEEITRAFTAFDQATGAAAHTGTLKNDTAADLAVALTALILGLRLRARSGAPNADINQASAALAHRLNHHS